MPKEDYKVVIGLETHVQLISDSKLFCSCKNPVTMDVEPEPNTLVCDICLGMPGSKPVFNEKILEFALKASLALNCEIAKDMFFSRKTYFYPDMSKNYQITQYEIPIAKNGWITIKGEDGKDKKIRIRRIHIEEDPAKIVHKKDYVLVDYNRAGVPLIEIVTEPDFSSPKEARAYLQKLVQILEYLGVYDSTKKATIKSDANISIVYNGQQGERVEVKNITGAKEIERALNYEIIRQLNIFRRGGKVVRETRGWDETAGVSRSMRSKEMEEEYGYIFDPDLTRITISEKEKEKIKEKMPELPDEKKKRLIKEYGLKEKTAEAIVSDSGVADLFEKACKRVSVKNASAWMMILLKTLNYNNLTYKNSGLKDEWVIEVIESYEKGEYSDVVSEEILRKMVEEKADMQKIVEKYGFKKVERGEKIIQVVKEVIAEFEKAVNDYKAGKEESLNFLVGQVMRKMKGAADPKEVREKIKEEISKTN